MREQSQVTMTKPRVNESWTLMIEDNPLDAEAVVRAWSEAGIESALVVDGDGEAAIDRLRAAEGRPSFVLLDLNMPRMSGFEFLRAVRAIDRLRFLPIVVFTTSDRIADREAALAAGACGYFSKPMDYDVLVEQLTIIHRYWSVSKRAW